jgi:hypothetical protein
MIIGNFKKQAQATASSMSLTSQSQQPATSSRVVPQIFFDG